MLSIFNMLSLPATDSAHDNRLLARSGDGTDGQQGFSQLLLGEKNRLSPNPELQDLAASIRFSNESTKTDSLSLPSFEADPVVVDVAADFVELPEELQLNLGDGQESIPTGIQALYSFMMARAATSGVTDIPIQPKPLTVTIAEVEPKLTEQPFDLLEDLPLPVLNFLKQAISELPLDHPVKQWLVDQQVIYSNATTFELSDDELSVILAIISEELAKTEPKLELVAWISEEVQPVLNPMMMQFASELARKSTTIFNGHQSIGDEFGFELKETNPMQAKIDASSLGTVTQGFKESTVVNGQMADMQPLDQSVTGLRTTIQAELSAQNELSNSVKQVNSVGAAGEELPELQEIRLEFLARQLHAPANAGTTNPVAISELMARQLASSSEFQSALNERIMTMVNGELKHAVIRLDPPELGALEIRIQVNQEQTSIQIISANPQVREALEAQSVRLREALAEQGLQLSNFDVNSQGSQSGSEQRQADVGSELLDSEGNPDGQNNDVIAAAVTSNRLVDDYA